MWVVIWMEASVVPDSPYVDEWDTTIITGFNDDEQALKWVDKLIEEGELAMGSYKFHITRALTDPAQLLEDRKRMVAALHGN